MKFIKISILLSLVIVLQFCSSPSNEVCNDGLNQTLISVLDPAGELADSVQITVKVNGEVLDICESFSFPNCPQQDIGKYLIMHDDMYQNFDQFKSTNVVVNGIKDSLEFSQEFSFRWDECHIRKVAGPDTVSLK